jgi:serine/threonine-protein kinase RsbT
MVEPFSQSFLIEGRNFLNAGKASTEIKSILKQLGVNAAFIRRVAIAAYEAEMNVVMYARKAKMTFQVTPQVIKILVSDEGPGIPDIERAMREGYSTATAEMREMGFGAGMGLPNIKRNSDDFTIESEVGKGTQLGITINIS